MNHNHSFKKSLPIVLCECGEEILVVPDLKEMGRCIETHAALHEKKEADVKKAKEEYRRIEELLTLKVMTIIADLPNNSV